jgi:hypothetical protein
VLFGLRLSLSIHRFFDRSIVGTLIAGLLTKPGGHTPGATPPGKPARQQGGGAALNAANLRAQWYFDRSMHLSPWTSHHVGSAHQRAQQLFVQP